jgi:hypothetical protein
MNAHPDGFEDLQGRLLKLEKQNRRFKQLGGTVLSAVLVIAAAVLVIGQVPSKKTVEANEFILRDNSGRVRAKLGMDDKMPGITLLNENGQPMVLLADASSYRAGIGGSVQIFNSQGQERGRFVADNGGMLSLVGGDPKTHTTTLTDEVLRVFDSQGFEAQLGVTDLVTPSTGETHKTSAASLVLFDKGKNVIWKAP